MAKQTYEPMGGIQIQITILELVSTAFPFQFLPAPNWRSKEGWDILCDSIPRVVPQYWVECYSVLERSWLVKFDSYKAEAFLPSINWYFSLKFLVAGWWNIIGTHTGRKSVVMEIYWRQFILPFPLLITLIEKLRVLLFPADMSVPQS